MFKTDSRKQRVEAESFLVPSATEPTPMGHGKYHQVSYIPVLRCLGADQGSVTLTRDEARDAARALTEMRFTPSEFEKLQPLLKKLGVPVFSPFEHFFGPPLPSPFSMFSNWRGGDPRDRF